jgi:asparagine synthase (glutamine-hydrolysing)
MLKDKFTNKYIRMCGILAILNNTSEITTQTIEAEFQNGKGRGPEYSIVKPVMLKTIFGFHRLAINGLNNESNQPIIIGDIGLICNGEIYNYKELYNLMDVEPTTDSDCEVIIHLYRKYDIEQTLQMLDGVFSFVLIDYRLSSPESKIIVARDPYGVRPLYMLSPEKLSDEQNNANVFCFGSEMKVLTEFKETLNNYERIESQKSRRNNIFDPRERKQYKISQFFPGRYHVYDLKLSVCSAWKLQVDKAYHKIGFHTNMFNNKIQMADVLKNIRCYLTSAVEKRCITTERPIACLLSGGLDSSLITALVSEFHKKNNLPLLETYSIGLAGSEDLKYAKIVADYLGTKHTEIVLKEQDFLDVIPDVIYAIESYDTTTVRASIGNWLLGRYISKNSEAKVIFNGDGSDELAGGYLYMNYAPDIIEFDSETRRLLKDIHTFDVLRSDKSISSHGLEPRTPFLDRTFVQMYMNIPLNLRCHFTSGNQEKYLIRKAFSSEEMKNLDGNSLLPDEILWRKKEAFSDGVSKHSRSLYEIIQEHTEKIFTKFEMMDFEYLKNSPDTYRKVAQINLSIDYLLPTTSEQYYYRKNFEHYYKNCGDILPYFWMPRYVNATDASARTLDIYNKKEELEVELEL